MSKVEEIEQVIEKLPPEDFQRLSDWITRRRAALGKSELPPLRAHSAFLNSYSEEDEGLYDAKGR